MSNIDFQNGIILGASAGSIISKTPIIPVDDALNNTSKNPVQNKVITSSLDDKLDITGGTMHGSVNMDGNRITDLPTPQQDGDAVPKNYVDRIPIVNVDYQLSGTSRNPVQNKTIKEALDGKLNKAGDSVSGNLNFGKKYGLYQVDSITIESEEEGAGGIGMNGNPIVNLPTPINERDAANKKYVDDADTLNEKLSNKATTLENADNEKYPTTLAVKNAIEATPASPATRYKLCVLKANWSNFGFTYSEREDGAYFECGFEIPIGVINDNVYTPKTNPVFPLAYGADTGYWSIDYALSFGKGSATALNEQVEISIPFDKTEAELMEESELASVRISLLKRCDTIEEAQEIAEQFEQIKDTFTKVDFVYETFVEQTVEFTE